MVHERRERHHVKAVLRTIRGGVALDEMPDLSGHMLPSGTDPTSYKKFTDQRRLQRDDEQRRREGLLADTRILLQRLLVRQRQEAQRGGIVLNGFDARSIFRSYRESALYPEAIEDLRVAVAYVESPLELRHRFAGRVHEDIVYGLLSGANTDSELVLSPGRTLEVARALAPEGIEVSFRLGQTAIYNSRFSIVPDGLSLSAGQGETGIAASLEYSLSTMRDWHSKQERFARTVREYPRLFTRNPLFVAVVPSDFPQGVITERADTRVLHVPFTARGFGAEFNVLMVDAGFPQVIASS